MFNKSINSNKTSKKKNINYDFAFFIDINKFFSLFILFLLTIIFFIFINIDNELKVQDSLTKIIISFIFYYLINYKTDKYFDSYNNSVDSE